MPRDTEKNKYFSVGIPKGSPLLQQLAEDAAACGISEAQLIALRVYDWYKGVPASSTLTRPSTAISQQDMGSVQSGAVEELSEEQMQANALALLDLEL